MFIRDIFQLSNPSKSVISFEIFPPKPNFPLPRLLETIETLVKLDPRFISVTYGAGGSSKDRTIEIASIIKHNYGIEALAHLTCISSTKDQIAAITRDLEKNEIRNVLALRGDLPQDPHFKFPTPLHYQYASDLIQELKKRGDYCIGAAFYPEGHLESPNLESDLDNLIFKIHQGVDFLISQMFFENRFFFESVAKLRAANIHVPICAGIMPIINAPQIARMADLCGCSIPLELQTIARQYHEAPDQIKKIGISYALKQIQELLQANVDGIHIYTMNKPEIAEQIVSAIRSPKKDCD